jgi:pimeloyl-ACP methyl ester carboxylesterase
MSMTRISGTCARYLIRDRVLYVFCRGTTSADPWWRNLLVRRVVWSGYRVNRADLDEALWVRSWLACERPHDRTNIVGFSRGAGVAALLTLMLPNATTLAVAPKRVGCRKLVRELTAGYRLGATAYRFDVVPLLPPWYAGWRCKWSGWMWPWKAHERSAKDAARWRHDVSKPMEDIDAK